MATCGIGRVVDHLRKTAGRDGGDRTDAELLGDFLARRDQTAFEGLLRRHGPMVLGVCRRLLTNACDAEDAFQATFLVLIRKAGSVRPAGAVGNWLYGVACRTARQARRAAARRQTHEKQVAVMPQTPVESEPLWHELRPILDRELGRLPDKLRLPVVLCDLEGRTRREVARELGLPDGTLSNRLSAARQLLARRLARHGLQVSGPALALVLGQQALAGVPAPLLTATIQAAGLLAAGQVATACLSVPVIALAERVSRAMTLSQIKSTSLCVFALCLLSGAAVFAALASDPPTPERPAAQQPKKDAGKKPVPDRQAIQGTWDVVAFIQDGKERPEEAKKRKFIITPTRILQKYDGRLDKDTLLYQLDPDAKPKAIDLERADRPGDPDKSAPGVYELQGDTLKLCVPKDTRKGQRPEEVASRPGSETVLFVLKRSAVAEKVNEKEIAAMVDVQQKRRVSTRKLGRIGLALFDYEREHGRLPAAAITDRDGKPLLSWRVAILPYLGRDGEGDLYRRSS
jgi:RNA polymerase sigma factor (sigma-70 family)